ncbi:MAG: hypothetical protein AWU57_320 [Marinobacter sp. T13-3]|nr:MAG: hypothetical protein AWU57_320 [Marinobacter sp. T13-3]
MTYDSSTTNDTTRLHSILRVAFLALIIILDVAYTEAQAGVPDTIIKGQGTVTRVVDGDTLTIRADRE